jgi:hypothetical protein
LSRISHKSLGELLIARACVKLLGIPDGSSEKSVSLTRIGSCEIRIFEGPQVTSDGMRSFWLELFDHGAEKSVDSRGFHEIEDAVVVFEDLYLAGRSLERSVRAGRCRNRFLIETVDLGASRACWPPATASSPSL